LWEVSESAEWVRIIKENAKTVWLRHPYDERVIKVKKKRLLGLRSVEDESGKEDS
jgi:hypothetical protein